MTDIHGHKKALETQGLTKIEHFVSDGDAKLARELIYKIATRHGLHSQKGWQRSENRFELDKSFRKALKALSASDTFPDLIGSASLAWIEDLLGEPVTPLPPGQQILFTLPETAAWSVPHDVWHVDAPRLGSLGPPGLQLFICLDDIRPKGGGTLVLAGSHRLLNTPERLKSREIKKRLSEADYFQWLFEPSREATENPGEAQGAVGNVELEVVELTGQAGDAYLMDLRCLHTPAPNASDTARMMLTCRLPRAAVASALLNPQSS